MNLCITARNLYQLNANEVPLILHYGSEGCIIILHKRKRHGNFLLDDAHAHQKSPLKSIQIAGGGSYTIIQNQFICGIAEYMCSILFRSVLCC